MDVAHSSGGRVRATKRTKAAGLSVARLIPREAAEAADRIAARLKADPKAAARLEAYVAGHAEAEATDSNETVREAVRGSGLSLQELARRTGVDVAALSRFMNGTGLTLATFDKLAGELELRIVGGRRRRSSSR